MIQKNTLRGTGRTTAQMASAPHGAVFVWVGHDTHYPQHLAHKIGREDLKIVGPDWLTRGWIGMELTGLVIDHDARLTPSQQAAVPYAFTRVRPAIKPVEAA